MITVVPRREKEKNKKTLGFYFMNIHLPITQQLITEDWKVTWTENKTNHPTLRYCLFLSFFITHDGGLGLWKLTACTVQDYLVLTAHMINSMQRCLMSLVIVL